MACQGQQQQQQQNEPGKPIDFNAGGFEGLESGQFALLAATCNPSADPVVITVASGEFAYLYKRTDGNVVVNANASGGGQCSFASTKNISIVAAEASGNQSHKVLIDYLSGTFSMGSSSAVGIAVDLKTTGVNQVMFRGTINPDVFSLGTVGGVSYLGFATGSATPVTAPTFANVSLTNVSDVTITAGPGDDIINGQGATAGLTSPASLVALDGAISLTVHGGDGADQITSGAASIGTAQNSLNGNNGSDIFHQPSALGSDVIAGGTDPTVTLTLSGTATGTNSAVVTVTGATTATTTASATGTATLTNSQTATATATKTLTVTATATAQAAINKATSATATATVSATQTASVTSTWTGVYFSIDTAGAVTTATRSYTGTLSNTGTVSTTLTLTATGTTVGQMTVTGSKSATATNTRALTGLATQTYTSLAVSLTNTSVQTDLSVDVVDYSHRTAPIKVTLGDQTTPVAASAKVVVPNSGAIRSYDAFQITDGELTDTEVSTSYLTRVVEFHRTGNYADATLAVGAGGGADLANDDTFTIDDGSHQVTFHILVGAGTNTLTGTATSLNIGVAAEDDRATAAAKIVAGITNYQTATWTGVAVGTATMTSTSIVPNVTVTAPDGANNDLISLQNRNTGAVAAFLASAAGGLTVTTNTSTSLWNANGAETIPVEFDDSTPINAAGMATLVQAAIAADTNVAVTAATVGSLVTITANSPIAVKPSFGVTLKSGGFAITMVSNGTPAAGPGANDGDIAGLGEKDSILDDVEAVIGGSGADTIDATHSTNIAHKLFGMGGADTLIVGTSAGGDVLYGGPGDDHLLCGGGVQTLYGGDGNDFLAGGLGNDIIDGDGPNCVEASTGVYASSICDATFAAPSSTAGSNYLDYSDRTAAVTVTISATMSGSGRASQIGVATERDDVTNCSNVRGGSGADTLTGSTGDNIIYGGPGDDTINGGGGNDSLYGDEGDDTISGDAGDDYIYGGSGVNRLYGDASGYTGTAGINMLDNSQGRQGVVDCGAGDMDILFSDGEETGTNTCELK
jgi:hypothetical protein